MPSMTEEELTKKAHNTLMQINEQILDSVFVKGFVLFCSKEYMLKEATILLPSAFSFRPHWFGPAD